MNKQVFENKLKLMEITPSKETRLMLDELKDEDGITFNKISKDTVKNISDYFQKELLKDDLDPDLILSLMLYLGKNLDL